MKKHLLTSTALVTAGTLAFAGAAMAQQKTNKPVLTLGGWAEQAFGFADNDNPGSYASGGNGFDVNTESEIHFKSAITLDNGINITTRIELEGSTSGDQIDENWMRVSGSFGTIVAGSTDEASKAMVTGYMGSWSTGVGQNLSFDVADWIEAPTGHAAGTVNRVTPTNAAGGTAATDDSENISYYTPRFAGFQLGASYTPGGTQDVNNTPATSSGNDHDGWSVGLNFDRKFGEFGLGAAIGYGQNKDALGGGADENTAIGGGIRVDFAGFRVGFGYVAREDAAGVNGSTTEGTSWDAGIRYTFGPNAVSLQYQDVENETVVGGSEDKTKQAMLAYSRTLGPGVNWRLMGMWADYEGATAGNSDDNDGYAVLTSIRLSF